MSGLAQLNWEDIRVFVALADSTSLREAAERLGVTHPTVRKRLDALETSLGLKLFLRRPDGLHVTADGEALIDAAGGVQRAIGSFARRARAVDGEFHGAIRLSITEHFARLLTPAIAAFAAECPQTPVHVDTGNDFADLDGTGIDVAVRIIAKGRQPDGHLSGRKAIRDGTNAVYGDSTTERWIGVSATPLQSGWTATTEFDDFPISAVIPSGIARREACREKMGIAMLPCLLGDGEVPRLTKVNKAFDVWLLVHPDLRTKPRLRIFREAMMDALQDLTSAVHGRG